MLYSLRMSIERNQDLYFAGPLFSQAEKEFNQRLVQRLEEELGVTVFLPQRDGMEFAKLQGMSPQEKTAAIRELDDAKVFGSKIFLCVLDGRVPDEGAAFELGMAYTHRQFTKEGKDRIMVGLLTDMRASFLDQQLNPMLERFEYIARSEDELLNYLKEKLGTTHA